MNYCCLGQFQGSLFGSRIGQTMNSFNKASPTWQIISHQLLLQLLEQEAISQGYLSEISAELMSFSAGELILATLPLILFFHNEPSLYWKQLEPLMIQKKFSLSVLKETEIGVEIFRLLLNDNINLPLTNYLIKHEDNLLLSQIRDCLQQKMSLTQTLKRLQKHTLPQQTILPLSLYCFCRTPSNFRLSTAQAAQIKSSSISALTGALSGAYNSLIGIPRNWRLSVSTDENLLLFSQQITTLWKMWIGIDKSNPIETPIETLGVTSIISHNEKFPLRLISQKEY